MTAVRLCQLREGFLAEWRRDYPCIPVPNLCDLEQVCESDVIDELKKASHVATISRSLNAVHNKIPLLREQVQRKVRLRDILIDLLRALNEEEGERWRGVRQSSSGPFPLDVNKPSLGNESSACCCRCHTPATAATTTTTATTTFYEGVFSTESSDPQQPSSCLPLPPETSQTRPSGTKLCRSSCRQQEETPGLLLSPTGNRDDSNNRRREVAVGGRPPKNTSDNTDSGRPRSSGDRDQNGDSVTPAFTSQGPLGDNWQPRTQNELVESSDPKLDLDLHLGVGLCVACQANPVQGKHSSDVEIQCNLDLLNSCDVNNISENFDKADDSYEVPVSIHSPSRVDSLSDKSFRPASLQVKQNDLSVEEGEEEVEEEEGVYDTINYHDNNATVINCSGSNSGGGGGDDMFRPKKTGGGSKGGTGPRNKSGGSPSSLRGSKDNFMAVTSKRRVSREEPSQSMRLKNDSPSGSPILARNFQMLKLTSGFDLVLGGDNDEGGTSSQLANRDGDASMHSLEGDSDSSKNSPDVRRAPPPNDDVTRLTASSYNDSKNSRVIHAFKSEPDSNKEQPDLIKSVSGTSSEVGYNPLSVEVEEKEDTSRSSTSTNNTRDRMPTLVRQSNISPLSPTRDSSKRKTPPPVPAKPRHGSLVKKDSSPLSPVSRAMVEEVVASPSEYSDSDILEALSDGDRSSYGEMHTSETSLPSIDNDKAITRFESSSKYPPIPITSTEFRNEPTSEPKADVVLRTGSDSEHRLRDTSPLRLSSSPSRTSDIVSMISTAVLPLPQAVDATLDQKERKSTFYVDIRDSPTINTRLSGSSASDSPLTGQGEMVSRPSGDPGQSNNTTTTNLSTLNVTNKCIPFSATERHDVAEEVCYERESAASRQRNSLGEKLDSHHVRFDEEEARGEINAESAHQEMKSHDESVVTRREKTSNFESNSSLSSDTSIETLVEGQSDDVMLRSMSCISDADVREAITAFDQVFMSTDGTDPSSPMDNEDDMMGSTAMNAGKRRSSTPSYVNWTINRALTSSIHSRDIELSASEDLTFEEEEEEEEGFSSIPSIPSEEDAGGGGSVFLPSPRFERPAHNQGSKDSGLCDDAISMTSDSVHLDLDLGRITDLRQIQEMERWEEEEEAASRNQKEGEFGGGIGEGVTGQAMDLLSADKDYDSVSVTSDIVFLPSTPETPHYLEGTDTDEDEGEHGREVVGQDNQLDSGSLASSLGDNSEIGCCNTSYDEMDGAREGMLRMRQLLVKGVLDSEKTFLKTLDVLIQFKNLLSASSQLSNPVISGEDIAAIFCNIDNLHAIHSDFVTALEPKVAHWTHTECIGEIFKIMVLKFAQFVQYVNNYPNAVEAIHRCGQENNRFLEVTKELKFTIVNTTKEVTSLEDALFKPVQRVQRNTLVLHDLIKHTPEDHPDHMALQKALKLSQHNLENYQAAVTPASLNHDNKRLVKNSFLVELVNGVRKLRYVFLFNDILVCTKRETHRNKKVSFVIKWYTHLAAMSFDTKFEYKDDASFSNPGEIEKLKVNIREVKKELRAEINKLDVKDKHRSQVSLGGGTRAIEKLRKKLNQYEGQLILSSPKLPFKVSLEGGKEYTLLMTTDYEKEEWKEALQFLCKKCSKGDVQVNSITVQDLINSVKETPQVNKIGNVLLKTDEEALMGTLNVNIHKMNGLAKDCDTYCCLEMDSFGHFFMMAKTRVCEASRDPIWNEDFDLELDGSQTLRILCFKKGKVDDGDILLGRGALELDRQWLKWSFQERCVSMNEISLVISVRHIPPEITMQRKPSRVINACFGVKITSSTKREGKMVPTIVTACIQEVEKRGMDEVGIYRVSGVTSDLQRLKKIFDKNVRQGEASLKDIDIHAVTGILKLYLRELPEPLFTEAVYQSFIDTLKLQDEEAKAQCLLSLYHNLPDANYYASVCILEHLVNVAHNVGKNKMSINNLATIFGPTLLAPATKDTGADPMEMMFKGTEEAMHQSSLINYILGLAVSGRSLRKSAQ